MWIIIIWHGQISFFWLEFYFIFLFLFLKSSVAFVCLIPSNDGLSTKYNNNVNTWIPKITSSSYIINHNLRVFSSNNRSAKSLTTPLVMYFVDIPLGITGCDKRDFNWALSDLIRCFFSFVSEISVLFSLHAKDLLEQIINWARSSQ